MLSFRPRSGQQMAGPRQCTRAKKCISEAQLSGQEGWIASVHFRCYLPCLSEQAHIASSGKGVFWGTLLADSEVHPAGSGETGGSFPPGVHCMALTDFHHTLCKPICPTSGGTGDWLTSSLVIDTIN